MLILLQRNAYYKLYIIYNVCTLFLTVSVDISILLQPPVPIPSCAIESRPSKIAIFYKVIIRNTQLT